MSKKTGKKVGVPRRKNVGSGSAGVSVAKRDPLRGPSDPSRARAQAKRHALYKRMLKRAPRHDGRAWRDTWGLCELRYLIDHNSNIYDLPELLAQRPKGNDRAYWWEPGEWKERRIAIQAAISESSPALGARKAATKERVPPKANGAKRAKKTKR